MFIKRFVEQETKTHTYLVYDEISKEAVIIDSVNSEVSQYIDYIRSENLKLKYSIDTHVHADHITGAYELKKQTGCQLGISSKADVLNADLKLDDNHILNIGALELKVLHTPGHTSESCCFLMNDRLFSGDTLLINGCGRTDFQNGSSKDLYNTIFNKLLVLPEETLVYPGHDYNNRTVSTIGEEKANSPRLQANDCTAFCEIMDNLNLPNPKYIDIAVPRNLLSGAEI